MAEPVGTRQCSPLRYDERYMRDAGHPAQEWRSLPNKPAILAALRTVDIPGIVGRFHQPPDEDATIPERWQHLAGDYYWLPTQTPPANNASTR